VKIATIIGTRPEIIRLSLIIRKLDQMAESHVLIHTGQNFVSSLKDVFFRELALRQPDYAFAGRELSFGRQIAAQFEMLERILSHERPDRVLVLGDTNSALSAILAERMGIPVFHMEAGNRCFDRSVPEELNRRIIDAVSTINMPYTSRSKSNLLREGIPVNRIVQTGNPIYEVLRHYAVQIAKSPVLDKLKLKPREYFLATVHRSENVDRPDRLREILEGFNLVANEFGLRVICSLHPRTRSRLADIAAPLHPLVEFHEPFGFFDFVALEKNARCALTDSGTVQEECCILRVPAVTVRTSTERPETVDCGSNVLAGVDRRSILEAVRLMSGMNADWDCPEGYEERNVSRKVAACLLGGGSV